MIAFYYALTGLACAVFYRRELTKSVKNFVFIGVGPLVGGAILGYLFVKSAIDFYDVENSYTGQSILGMGVPFVIGMGFLLLGVVLMVLWRLGGHERFFGRRAFEAVDPQLATRAAARAVSRTIVVGVDGSPGADAALDTAIELAGALGDELVVAHAAEPPFRSVGEEWRESERALAELGAGLTAKAVERAAQAGITAEPVARPDAPGRRPAARSRPSATRD